MNDKTLSIHQLVSGFVSGDAISLKTITLRNFCRKMGFISNIYAPKNRIAPDMMQECEQLENYDKQNTDFVINHYSSASEVEDFFIKSSGKKIILYHNITPAEFFDPFDSVIAEQLRESRRRLPKLIQNADGLWAVSEYNAIELRSLGGKNVRVFPLIFTSSHLEIPNTTGFKLEKDLVNILFVGRMAPNKCIEELITAFCWYNMRINSNSRLVIVGSERTAPAYFSMLRLYTKELSINNVCFQRFVAASQLSAYYEAADLFVCTSKHEGYCMPLVEAMYRNVPVISRRIGGTPEALGGAGILYDNLKPEELALLFNKVLTDQDLRKTVLESQAKRMKEILTRPVEQEFKNLLRELIPSIV